MRFIEQTPYGQIHDETLFKIIGDEIKLIANDGLDTDFRISLIHHDKMIISNKYNDKLELLGFYPDSVR